MSRNVFLSFVEEDLTLVNAFRAQAKNENNDLEFSDYSVKEAFDSQNADYIRQQIRKLLEKVSVTVCLIGYSTSSSSWVNWELRESAKMDKGLVGVRLHSSDKDTLPAGLTENHHYVANWDIKDIVKKIELAAENRQPKSAAKKW